MKRLIKDRQQFLIYAGIQVSESGGINFTWNRDSTQDVVHLANDTSGEFSKDGLRIVYGYKFSDSATSAQKKLVRDYLKQVNLSDELYSENIQEFVDSAVLRLDERYPLEQFEATVFIQSTTGFSLVDLMRESIWTHRKNLNFDFQLVKAMYQHVKFNAEKAYQSLIDSGMDKLQALHEVQFTSEKFESLKQSGQLFQMKRFIPKEIRSGFYDFLQFASEEERNVYASLQGVNVLIFDDFLTSGSTIMEVNRYLQSINPKNKLTAFVLVKQ